MELNGLFIWLIIALICAILELFTGALVMLSLGIAAAITGAWSSIFNTTLKEELIVLSIGTLIIFFALGPVFKKVLYKNKLQTKIGIDAYLGTQRILMEGIEGTEGVGKIKLGSEIWNAKNKEGKSFPQGATVIILEVSGTTLYVAEPLTPTETT